GESLLVGIETFECLFMAETVRLETGGAFDVNSRAAARTGPDGEPSGRPAYPGPEARAFELVREGGSFLVRRPENIPSAFPGLDLDLGAVGKGYALDLAADVLRDWGVENALLHGGTSTALAAGAPAADRPDGWAVGVGAGWPGAPSSVTLSGRAVSGSGTEVKGGHILDPRTGRAARGNLAAWASAPTAALSDALSTAFFVMTADDVEALAARNPDVWACLVVSYGDARIFNPGIFSEKA
ncbi:MAG: FAD:protein FMN transferase, partial [Candidatus Aminicenantes bacterium]|nr:FAD:protein FMN transferase [Candidatus Aminicenantes bacterium]